MRALTLLHVTKRYGELTALFDFSMRFRPGIYGILGANGAGKSTMMNLITDNIRRDEGVIRYGKVPGTLNMRSQRIMRFLRPLGLQLPFKMVIHKQLPQIAAVVNRAILEHTV